MKRIALFGGSFNPPHPGHFDMAKYIYETLGVDEIWFLFSENWQKDASKYASAEDRMEMGRILARHYPAMPFVMSGIQDELGTHITCATRASLIRLTSRQQIRLIAYFVTSNWSAWRRRLSAFNPIRLFYIVYE